MRLHLVLGEHRLQRAQLTTLSRPVQLHSCAARVSLSLAVDVDCASAGAAMEVLGDGDVGLPMGII